MKKIKGLLLFGILILLGIGSSFGQFVHLNDSTGSQLLIPNMTYVNWVDYNNTITYYLGDSTYYSRTNGWGLSHRFQNVYACRDSVGNAKGFYHVQGTYPDYDYAFTFGEYLNCSSTDLISVNSGNEYLNYLYMSSTTPISPYDIRSGGSITNYIYFDYNNVYTNYGYFPDVTAGYYRKTVFLNNAGTYSFANKSETDGSYYFSSILRDSWDIHDLGGGFYNLDIDGYEGFLFLNYNDYSTEYYYKTGSRTLIISFYNNSLAYNIYTGYFDRYDEIVDINNNTFLRPVKKGYLLYNDSTGEAVTQFFNMLNSSNNFILTNGTVSSVNFKSYGYKEVSSSNHGGGLFTQSSLTSFDLSLNDDSVPDFLDPHNINGGSLPVSYSMGIFGTDSLYYYCNFNSDTFDSSICLNPDGSFKSDTELKNCYTNTYINMSGGQSIEYSQYYCIDSNGLIQDIQLVESGAGVIFAPCQSDSCRYSVDFSSLGLTGYSEDFFDGYLNKTGYFFKCPWNYDSNLTIRPKLVDLLNGFDILLSVNCSIAGFHHGKDLINFSDSGSIIGNGPLLNFEGENRKSLYLFFDILISIGIVLFVGKIFYLFHK